MNTNPTTDDPQFGIDGCTCIPFTRQTDPPRYCQPGDTIDMVTGWERGRDCPHHTPDPSSPPGQTLRDRLVAAIKASPFQELRTVDFAPNGPLLIKVKVDDLADTLMRRLPAVLPPPADRAAVLPSVRPQTLAALAGHLDARAVAILRPESEAYAEWQTVASWLRRLAAEAQQPEPESGCAHCGGSHAWDDCEAYTALVREDGAEAPQPDTEARTSWTPGPVALARAVEWATKRQDATVDPAMCPRCKGDNSEAFELCTRCATTPAVPVQPAADGSGEEA